MIAEPSPQAASHPLLIGGREAWLVPIAEHIREVVALTDRSARPKPIAHPYLKAGDPSKLALAAVGAIRDGLREDSMAVTRLAQVIGATAEQSMVVARRGTLSYHERAPWEDKVRVRVGLSLLNGVLMATGWFSLAVYPHRVVRAGAARRTPKLVLVTKESLAPWLGQRLDRDLPGESAYRPTIRDLVPPFETLRGLLAGQSLTLVLTETAGDLPGGNPAPTHRTPPQRV